jgi:tetraacyldisaccharide 4'-kinase
VARAPAYRPPVPVVCVGNVGAGGSGKTPVAASLVARLSLMGVRAHILSRGYRGRLGGPVRVDPDRHEVGDVGDEPLLLARRAPVWVAEDRAAGARAAVEAGAQAIVMDDGFQNPAVAKDLSLVVVDGGYGFGNGRILPAGPLREPIDSGLRRATAAIVVGDDQRGVARLVGGRLPTLGARLRPTPAAAEIQGRRVVAFAGIGRPAKFFATLAELGAEIMAREEFADHHVYTPDEAMRLVDSALKADAVAVTTAKDHVRLPDGARAMIVRIDVELEFDDERALDALLRPALSRAAAGTDALHG